MRIRPQHIMALTGTIIVAFVLFAVVWMKVTYGGTNEGIFKHPSGKGRIPIIEVPGKEFDLGTIPNDKPTEAEMPVKNIGSAPLVIEELSTACGYCVQPSIDDKNRTIPPGHTAHIDLKFLPTGVPGFEGRKAITIRSNDPRSVTTTIDIVAKIEPEFSVTPNELVFGEVEKGTTPEKSLIWRQVQEEPIEVKGVEPHKQGEFYTATLKKRPESEWQQAGKPEYLITVKLKPSVPVGHFYDALKINTSCERLKHFAIPIHADVETFYTVEPRMLVNRARVKPGDEKVTSTRITADRPIEVVQVETSSDSITAEAVRGDAPHTFDIVVNVTDKAKPGLLREEITFVVKSGEREVPHTARVYLSIAEELPEKTE